MAKLTIPEYNALSIFVQHIKHNDTDEAAVRFNSYFLLEVLGAVDKVKEAVRAEIDRGGVPGLPTNDRA